MGFKWDHLAPGRAFLILGAIFGLVYLFVTPPFMVPDEREHFYRAYSISLGQFSGGEALLPRSVVEFAEPSRAIPFFPERKISGQATLAGWNTPLEPARLAPATFPGASVYSPLVYLPHAAGILIGRLLLLSPLLIFYVGRLASFAAWLALSTLAVGMVPVSKKLFGVLLLMPMTLFQGASLSADTTTIGICFLFIAFCLRLALDPAAGIGRKELGLLGLLFAVVPVTKAPYALLTLLFFLIPPAKFGSRRRWLVTGAFLFAGTILITILVATAGIGEVRQFRQGLPNPGQQLASILQDPLAYLKTIARTLVRTFPSLEMMFVGYLGWLEVRLPEFFYNTYPLLILLAALWGGDRKIELKWAQRLAFLAIFGLILLGVYTTLYLTFTAPGAPLIEGVQGRYLIPFSPLLFLPFYNRRLKCGRRWLWIPALFYIFAAQAAGLTGLVSRYWIR